MSYASLKNCEECERPSNNKFFNCPPRMSDGRHFTDYRPRCALQHLDNKTNFQSSYEYRLYLQRNAEQIIAQNAEDAYKVNQCGPCVEPYDIGTMLPELEKQVCNERTCTFNVNDPYGLGLGRNYSSEQVDKFNHKLVEEKSKEKYNFKESVQCCGTIQDDLQYFPINKLVENNYPRQAHPGGGNPLSGGDRLM